MIPTIGLVVMSAILPLTAEVDFASLPPKGNVLADYSLKVKLLLSDKKDLEFSVVISKNADQEDVRASVFAALKLSGWDAEKEGEKKIRVVGKGKAHVTKIEFESPNTEPVVKWVPKK